nr:hypothetical protein [Tanacetum cinerariifolium]
EVRESEGESDEEETRQEEEENFDLIPITPEESKEESNDEEEHDLRLRVESIFMTTSFLIVSLETLTPIMTPSTIATITTSGEAPIPPPTIPSIILENLPTFNSAFRFEERLRSLETSFFEYRQTNLFADAVSAIPGIVHQYMTQQMKEAVREATNQFAEAVSNILGIVHQYISQQMMKAVREAVQIQIDRLQDSFQRENDEFLCNIDENMKRIIKGQNLYKALVDAFEADKTVLESYRDTAILKRRREDDDDQEAPFAGSDRGSKRRREGREPESRSGTYADYLSDGQPPHPVFETGAVDQPIVQTSQHPEWFSQPRKPPTPNRD